MIACQCETTEIEMKKINSEEMEKTLAKTWKRLEKDYSEEGWGDGDEAPIKKETFDLVATLIRDVQKNLEREELKLPRFLILPCADGDLDIDIEDKNAELLISITSNRGEKHGYYGKSKDGTMEASGDSNDLTEVINGIFPVLRLIKE